MKEKNNYAWVDKELYPFAVKTAKVEGHNISYIDEGGGDCVLFVHGTPGWSFEYRRLVQALSPKFRCVALDHLGFGLSDKPDADYSPRAHSERLMKFIDSIGLKSFHLVVHDFGGPIGLAMAQQYSKRIKSITAMNTWLWALDGYDHFKKPAKIISTFAGKWLYESMNFSAKFLVKTAFYDKSKLTPAIHKQYIMAQNRDARKAAYAFALSLLGESEWYNELWNNRSVLKNIPFQIIWGMHDTLLPSFLLDKWREGFEGSGVTEIQAGHFPHEEEPDKTAQALVRFFKP